METALQPLADRKSLEWCIGISDLRAIPDFQRGRPIDVVWPDVLERPSTSSSSTDISGSTGSSSLATRMDTAPWSRIQMQKHTPAPDPDPPSPRMFSDAELDRRR